MLLEGLNKKNLTDESADEGKNIPAAISDTGCERDLNEDRYAVVESPSGVAWLVCDGMGGVNGGELAAQIAIDAIRRDLETLQVRRPEAAFRSALQEANRIIVLRRQNQAFAGMGTTIVGAVFSGPEVVVGHVGDSRAYLIRDGAIQQLTVDHTYVQELVEKGQIAPEDALSHPQAHILTKCIGSEPSLGVVFQKYWVWDVVEAEPVDCLMLCTDGLYSLVSEGEMATIVSQHAPQKACVKLVELAKARGGFDNITLALIPLGGQLRHEPPAGYDENAVMKRAARGEPNANRNSRSFVRLFVIVFMLSSLAALCTALLMAFVISR